MMTDQFEKFVNSITQLYRCIQKIKNREMTELGLKGTHVMCLFHLKRHEEGLTAGELSSLCLEDKAAISRAISDLSHEGLVTQEEAGSKRRYRSRIHLTDSGKSVAAKMVKIIENAVTKGGAGLSAGELDTFYKALNVISSKLRAVSEAPAPL